MYSLFSELHGNRVKNGYQNVAFLTLPHSRGACLGVSFLDLFLPHSRGRSWRVDPPVMTPVILSGGMKMRDEHGMLREVYMFCHDFCHTFRSSMECLGRYTFALCFFFAASFTASFAAFREALSLAASFAAFRQLLCHTLCAQKQIDKNTRFYKDNDNDNNNTRTNT